MDQFYELWQRTKQFAGVLFVVLLSLYLIRCLVKFHLLSIAEYEVYINRIVHVIVA